MSLTQFQLQGYTQQADTQGTFSLTGSRGHGTVYIASDLYAKISTDEKVRTYFHELANILSSSLTRTMQGSLYGNPNGIGHAKDPDTGARFEKCVFGSVPF